MALWSLAPCPGGDQLQVMLLRGQSWNQHRHLCWWHGQEDQGHPQKVQTPLSCEVRPQPGGKGCQPEGSGQAGGVKSSEVKCQVLHLSQGDPKHKGRLCSELID